jgi:signal transduction histidine kinase/DNA-binding response OmpR family regulator
MSSVLVVDDQKVPRVAVAMMLNSAGYTVAMAESGREGLERARVSPPDVVVLDLQMPEMDGFEVVERLKQNPVTAAIPILLLTAQTPSDDLIVRGLELGAYDFLSKGCSRAELLARVGVMARIKRGYDELSAMARVSGLALESRDLQSLADGVVEQVAQTFRADTVVLDLPGDGSMPEVRAGMGVSPEDPRFYVLVDLVLERLSCTTDTSAVPFPAEEAGECSPFPGGPGAAVCIPRAAGGPMLLAVFRLSGNEFTPSDLQLLALLARQSTLSLDNAVLHGQTRQQALALQEQAAALESAMTDKSRFFASMSHELRTPLNAIIGYGDLLREGVYGDLQPNQNNALERVVKSGHHLLELVNDVLDISKMEAGKLDLFPEPTELSSLIREMAATVELQARAKKLDLILDLPGRLTVTTDPSRLRQIILNLLSNAVKFTDTGSVKASFTTLGRWAEIRVEDTGLGISPEDQERVFQEFEQTSGAAGRGGTGLGLPISRRLAGLLGGSLTLASTPGAGSVFTLRIPLTPPAL